MKDDKKTTHQSIEKNKPVKNNQKISTNASTEFPKELLTDSSNFSNNPINSVLRKESKNFKSKSILLPETITKPADYMSNILPKKEVPAEEKKNKTSLEESENKFYEKMMKNFNKADSKTKHNKSSNILDNSMNKSVDTNNNDVSDLADNDMYVEKKEKKVQIYSSYNEVMTKLPDSKNMDSNEYKLAARQAVLIRKMEYAMGKVKKKIIVCPKEVLEVKKNDEEKFGQTNYDIHSVNKIQDWWRSKLPYLMKIKFIQSKFRLYLFRIRRKLARRFINNVLKKYVEKKIKKHYLIKKKYFSKYCQKVRKLINLYNNKNNQLIKKPEFAFKNLTSKNYDDRDGWFDSPVAFKGNLVINDKNKENSESDDEDNKYNEYDNNRPLCLIF